MQVFTQQLLLDREDVRVTFAREVDLESPVVVDDEVVLESGSDVVWFTFPGRWHDIGRFHRPDDTFTGIYANILTPPVFVKAWGRGSDTGAENDGPGEDGPCEDGPGQGGTDADGAKGERPPREIWQTTDLFLDVWLPTDGGLFVLDRDQLDEAVQRGWLSGEVAERAREEVVRIEEAHGEGRWPPSMVKDWTLDRARKEAGISGGRGVP